MNSGVKAISPVATSAPTPTRIAVDGIAIDRKARFSAKAKTSAIQKAQALCAPMKAITLSMNASMPGPRFRRAAA